MHFQSASFSLRYDPAMRVHRRCEVRMDGQMATYVHGPVALDEAVAEIVKAVGGDAGIRSAIRRAAMRQLSEGDAARTNSESVLKVTLEYRLRPGDKMPAHLCPTCGYDQTDSSDHCAGCGKTM